MTPVALNPGLVPQVRHACTNHYKFSTCTELVCSDLAGASANTQPGARLDIAANGVWGGSFERTFFDVRVFNPHARPSNCLQETRVNKKKGPMNKEFFSPLVLSATGGLAREATTFYKRLASMLSSKWDQTYYAGSVADLPFPSFAHPYKPSD